MYTLNLDLPNILLIATGFFFLIQLIFFLLFFMRMTVRGKKETEENELKPVSVIICARNEEQNLMEYLPKVLDQDYPNFQVVIVNDRSWDETWDVMEAFARKFDNIKLVNIPDAGNDGYAKKYAITIGVKAAKYDQLVFIDADCYPVSRNWLKEMASKFSVQRKLVLGAGAFVPEKGFANKIIRYDACQIALQYLSFAKAGVPYMGVGRNLGYKNELYDSVRGFKSHYHIASGDDDLFVNQTARKKNTNICFSPESITLSKAKPTLKDWRIQKRRHVTTGKYYRGYHKFLLGLFPVSYVFFLILAITTAIVHPLFYIPLGLIGVRIVLQYITSYRVFKTMMSKDVIFWIPFIEIIMLYLNPYLLLTSKRYNKLR
jgi:glycosyltransferase involved in cell wall biosynthesis